jgi:hypothetical protein
VLGVSIAAFTLGYREYDICKPDPRRLNGQAVVAEVGRDVISCFVEGSVEDIELFWPERRSSDEMPSFHFSLRKAPACMPLHSAPILARNQQWRDRA